MALMRTCCCGCNMKTACKASGIYFIVISILGLLWGVAGLVLTSWAVFFIGALYSLQMVHVVFEAVLLVAGILLVVGASKGYKGRNIVLAGVIMTGLYLLQYLAVVIYMNVLYFKLFGAWVFVSGYIIFNEIIWVVLLIFFILGLLCGISFYQQLTEEGPGYDLRDRYGVGHRHDMVMGGSVPPRGYPPVNYPPGNYPPDPRYDHMQPRPYPNDYRDAYPQKEPYREPYEYGGYEDMQYPPSSRPPPSHHSRPPASHHSRPPPSHHSSRHEKPYGPPSSRHDRYDYY